MIYTAGIDVGSSAIKSVVMSFDDSGGDEKLLATSVERIRRRNIKDVIRLSFDDALKKANLTESELIYVATTGEGQLVDFRRGHFYSMTTHARGAKFLIPEARGVIDVGALHAKAIIMDERSKVLGYRMTSQCASGSGQFLENITRYLGVSAEDVGQLSLSSDDPQLVSSICCVLAETDVINMVSREITPANILKGIHLSIGKRLIGLLRKIKAKGVVVVTGGLASDEGFLAVLRESAEEAKLDVEIRGHELSVYGGAIGAAIWGAFRHIKLLEPQEATDAVA